MAAALTQLEIALRIPSADCAAYGLAEVLCRSTWNSKLPPAGMASSFAARLGAGTLNLMELGPIATGAPERYAIFDRCVVIRRHGVCRMYRELIRITDVARHVCRFG